MRFLIQYRKPIPTFFSELSAMCSESWDCPSVGGGTTSGEIGLLVGLDWIWILNFEFEFDFCKINPFEFEFSFLKVNEFEFKN